MARQTTDSSVSAVVGAFGSGLNVFEKLKKKRRKTVEARLEDEEVRLRRSLQKGPIDIQQAYNRNFTLQGARYREGDSTVIATLAAVLLKLNNGLVEIISRFLSRGKKRSKLDYRSFTSLSEISRMEAIEALSQLSLRISRSSLNLMRPSEPRRTSKKKSERTKKSSKPIPNGTSVGIVKSANASAPQLAMIRPHNKRSTSGSSARSQVPLSPKMPSPTTPPPPYVSMAPPMNKSTPNLHRQLYPAMLSSMPLSPPLDYPPPPPRVDPIEQIGRRRADRVTPSMYTFASDSTKLGEIPMRKWNNPFDYDEMGRRNKEAAMGMSQQHLQQTTTLRKKRGFFAFFKKTGNPNNATVDVG